MTKREQSYRDTVELFKDIISEEEFLRIYHIEDDAERISENAKLSAEQQAAMGHLYVAYRLLLRERGVL